MREYDLIRTLSDEPWHLFRKNALGEPLSLFQTHFLLFHVLHQLRQEWATARKGWLIIDPLGIRLLPWSNVPPPEQTQVVARDPLADYYLNIEHLFNTSEADVKAMLDHFFRRLLHPEQREQALATLGLPPDCRDKALMQKRYRSLAMKHHPDRGGDASTFQAIQSAWTYLRSLP